MAQNPTQQIGLNLAELKKRLEQSKPVVVDDKGHIHNPDDPAVAQKVQQGEVTTVKPTRWYVLV